MATNTKSQRRFDGKWFSHFESKWTEKAADSAAKKKRAQGFLVRVTYVPRSAARDIRHLWVRKKK